MHSLNHIALARADAAARVTGAPPASVRRGRRHPPPVRGTVARAIARVAVRVDHDAARRAIA